MCCPRAAAVSALTANSCGFLLHGFEINLKKTFVFIQLFPKTTVHFPLSFGYIAVALGVLGLAVCTASDACQAPGSYSFSAIPRCVIASNSSAVAGALFRPAAPAQALRNRRDCHR